MSHILRNRSSLASSFLLFSICSLLLPLHAQAQPTTSLNDELGFFNPTSAGGSWLTVRPFLLFSNTRSFSRPSHLLLFVIEQTWNNWYAGGEPLNVVISSKSDPSVLEYEGFLDYCSSLRFSPQCFQWVDHNSLQAANLGDGNELGAMHFASFRSLGVLMR